MSFDALRKVRKEVQRGAVIERPVGNLSLFTYAKDCMFSDLWNPVVKRCRGIVFDTAKGKVVARPMDKFFNINERPSTSTATLLNKADEMSFEITEKLDGSMVALWFYDGEWRASTPGSLESDQAKYAKEVLFPRYDLFALPTDLTYVCELITPWDGVNKVVKYGERDELVVLCAFETAWDQIEVPRTRLRGLVEKAGLSLVKTLPLTKSDFLTHRIPYGEEGYVIRFEDGSRYKVKSRWYFRWHRALSMLSRKNVLELMKDGQYDELLAQAPPQIYEAFDDLAGIIKTTKASIELEVNKWWALVKDPNDHKSCALFFQNADPHLRPILFARMREKDETKAIWKAVERELGR